MIRSNWLRMLGCCPAVLVAACGNILPPPPAPLFAIPLEIEGRPVGDAIIDTGGGFEILLRRDFGLSIVDTVDVLVFGGRESVALTEGFSYTAGGFHGFAEGAIVGISSCDCNGVGIAFFRKTGMVAAIAFSESSAAVKALPPRGGIDLPFRSPPANLKGFISSFIDVEIDLGTATQTVRALLDTGASETLVKRKLVPAGSEQIFGRVRLEITHDRLGTVSVSAALFDNDDLPDVILGIDMMRAWGDRWYFHYTPDGGNVTVFPYTDPPMMDGSIAARGQ